MVIFKKKLNIANRIRKSAVRRFPDVEGGNSELSCMCAIVSVALAKAFRKNGFRARVAFGNFNDNEGTSIHCWVVSGKKIWDLTATQFGQYPDILIASVGDKRYKYHCWVKKGTLKDWPIDQIPTEERVKKILK